jgi:hypothetical protein
MNLAPHLSFQPNRNTVQLPIECFCHLLPLLSGSAFKVLVSLHRNQKAWGGAPNERVYAIICHQTGIKTKVVVAKALRELLALSQSQKPDMPVLLNDVLASCPLVSPTPEQGGRS